MLSSNILQPSSLAQNCADPNSAEFMTSLCQALLHTTNNDNSARMQAETYMKSASKSQGCLSSLLQIATNQQVSPRPVKSPQNYKCKLVIKPKTICTGRQRIPRRCEPAGRSLPKAYRQLALDSAATRRASLGQPQAVLSAKQRKLGRYEPPTTSRGRNQSC